MSAQIFQGYMLTPLEIKRLPSFSIIVSNTLVRKPDGPSISQGSTPSPISFIQRAEINNIKWPQEVSHATWAIPREGDDFRSYCMGIQCVSAPAYHKESTNPSQTPLKFSGEMLRSINKSSRNTASTIF